MNEHNLMDMMNQIIATASSSNASQLNTLTGAMALLNLYGIVNYLNQQGGGAGNITIPPGVNTAGGGSMTGAPNPEMLKNLISMLGNVPGQAGTAGNSSGAAGMPPGFNPEMISNIMSMLNGMTPSGSAASSSDAVPPGNTGMPGGLNLEMLMSMMSMLTGAMPGGGNSSSPSQHNTSGNQGGLNPEILMKLMTMMGGMPGAASGTTPGGDPPVGLNPEMLIKMMSMMGGNNNTSAGTGLPLPGPLANLSPEMLMGLMSMLGKMGGGYRPHPPRTDPGAAASPEHINSDDPLPDESWSAGTEGASMNPQMMMLLMNLLSSMNQGSSNRLSALPNDSAIE